MSYKYNFMIPAQPGPVLQTFLSPGEDRNFALESYGGGSRCFDHTEEMWEERSCDQVRQWQHWGSGCYNFNCQDGRLQIVVLNQTYTCFYPGQELKVSPEVVL